MDKLRILLSTSYVKDYEYFNNNISLFFDNVQEIKNAYDFTLFKKNKDLCKLIDIAIIDITDNYSLELIRHLHKHNEQTVIIIFSDYKQMHLSTEDVASLFDYNIFKFLLMPISRENILKLFRNLKKDLIIIKKQQSNNLITLNNSYIWDDINNVLIFNNTEIKLTQREKKLIKQMTKRNDKSLTYEECYEVLKMDSNNQNCANKLRLIISRLNKKTPSKIISCSATNGYYLDI